MLRQKSGRPSLARAFLLVLIFQCTRKDGGAHASLDEKFESTFSFRQFATKQKQIETSDGV